jgi:hypothetical protein
MGQGYTEIYRQSNSPDFANPGYLTSYISAGVYMGHSGSFSGIPSVSEAGLHKVLQYTIDLIKNDGTKARNTDNLFIGLKSCGVYITLHKGGKLISAGAELFTQSELSDAVRNAVGYLLLGDPVSGSLKPSDLDGAVLELTITGRPKRLFLTDDFPESGLLYLKNKNCSSMIRLDNSSKDKTLRNICLKAGLSYNCFNDSATEIYHFNTVSIKDVIR